MKPILVQGERRTTLDPLPFRPKLGIVTASALMAMDFPPVSYVVNGVLPEGLTLLAGKPKGGKSWLCLDFAIAVALGGVALGKIQVQQGDVLGLALEDNLRRLQGRLRQKLGDIQPPDRLHLETEWPRLNEGGIEKIEGWIRSVEHPRLVMIDVFAKVRPPKHREQGLYEADYAAAAPLKQLADRYSIGVVAVHHVSKRTDASDPFDEVSGTTGLTGVADTVLLLRRGTEGTTLYGRGRDMPEIDKAMRFDEPTGSWTILGDADAVLRSDTRNKILDVVGASLQPCSPKQIAEWTQLSQDNVYVMLGKMVKSGEVEKVGLGKYVRPKHGREE